MAFYQWRTTVTKEGMPNGPSSPRRTSGGPATPTIPRVRYHRALRPWQCLETIRRLSPNGCIPVRVFPIPRFSPVWGWSAVVRGPIKKTKTAPHEARNFILWPILTCAPFSKPYGVFFQFYLIELLRTMSARMWGTYQRATRPAIF